MAPKIGKRKRRNQLDLSNEKDDDLISDDDHAQDSLKLFRQHFEANFEPLEELESLPIQRPNSETGGNISASDSDWDGLSKSESDEAEIVHHSASLITRTEVPKAELKSFMTAKPPSSGGTMQPISKKKEASSASVDEIGTDAANIKKDLALQRLLKEAHLLDSQDTLVHIGHNRHKALDLRLQDMGSKSSIFTQQNMPLAQRKGITMKAAKRDDLRRRQAQENGIIIEKSMKAIGKDNSKRQRGIGAPAVGKFQGGMLKLSKKDVADIEGPKKPSKGRR